MTHYMKHQCLPVILLFSYTYKFDCKNSSNFQNDNWTNLEVHSYVEWTHLDCRDDHTGKLRICKSLQSKSLAVQTSYQAKWWVQFAGPLEATFISCFKMNRFDRICSTYLPLVSWLCLQFHCWELISKYLDRSRLSVCERTTLPSPLLHFGKISQTARLISFTIRLTASTMESTCQSIPIAPYVLV